jgi:hypothetical protein
LALLGSLALQTGDSTGGIALLEESLELAARIGWRWWRAGTLSAIADVAIAEGRGAEARALLRDSLDLALELGDRVGLAWYLGQISLTLAREGRKEEAGRLWGAVEAAAVLIPGGPWPRDVDRLERDLSELADDAFEQGRVDGRGLSLEAVARAISEHE